MHSAEDTKTWGKNTIDKFEDNFLEIIDGILNNNKNYATE